MTYQIFTLDVSAQTDPQRNLEACPLVGLVAVGLELRLADVINLQ